MGRWGGDGGVFDKEQSDGLSASYYYLLLLSLLYKFILRTTARVVE